MSNITAASWIQSQLTWLYGTTNSFDDSFEEVFAPACEVRSNHVVQPLQAFKRSLGARLATAVHASVVWNADLISTNDKPEEPAVVAGAFVVARSLPFRIRGARAQQLMHVHFSARIERDASVEEGDQRRITSFYYTSVDKTPPIHLSTPREVQEGPDVPL